VTPDDPAAVAVRSASWIQVAAAPPIPDSLRPFRLDRGEEAVLALALVPSEEETEVVLEGRGKGTSQISPVCEGKEPQEHARKRLIQAA